MRKGRDLLTMVDSGGAAWHSGPFRVMQRPESTKGTKVDGDGARAHWSVARRKKKERRQRGRMKSKPVALFIRQ